MHYGSKETGREVPGTLGLTTRDTVLSAGVGEDVSFDIDLQRATGATIVLVDPTPRAIAHVDSLRSGESNYDLRGVDLQKMPLDPTALWVKEGFIEFWAPDDPSHVSYSIVNLQGTSEALRVPCARLSTILRRHGIEKLKLLKIDIEGAEIEVLGNMLDEGIRPQCILVEFDELNFPGRSSSRRVINCVERLLHAGYQLIAFDGYSNCVFHRGDATTSVD